MALLVWIWAHPNDSPRKRSAALRDSNRNVDSQSVTVVTASNPTSIDYRVGKRIWRDRVAWQVSLYMGTQSFIFYIMATWFPTYLTTLGRSPAMAGVELMIFQLFGIAGSVAIPYIARGRLGPGLPAIMAATGVVAWTGMVLLPGMMAAWIVIGGFSAGSTLTLSLMLMAQRARTQAHSTALSGMAQSLGYAIAAIGPVTFGWVHGLSGECVLPFCVIWACASVQLTVGLILRHQRPVLEQGPAPTMTP